MKFEDLVRILEEEKKSTLSRISTDFYSIVQGYIKELEEAEQKISRRHSEESIMIQYELKNALSTVDKIFNRRTRKIIKMASGKAFSKNSTNIAHDIENMTPEEKQVYQQVLDAILSGKKNTIEPILGTSTENESDIKPDSKPAIKPDRRPDNKSKNDSIPDSKPDIEPESKPSTTTLVHDTDEHMVPAGSAGYKASQAISSDTVKIPGVQDQEKKDEKRDVLVASPADNTPVNEKSSPRETKTQVTSPILHEEEMDGNSGEKGKKDLNKEYIVVRLLKDIPKFSGADGRNYRLGAQDVAVLPKVNANPLIKRKVAVQIESNLQQSD
jgi:DNA replication initiation complex subunit (GINS family)